MPNPEILYRVNLEGTVVTLLAARAAKVRRIVYTSSIAAVGLKEGGTADESNAFDIFDVAKHPEFTFTAESVTPTDGGVRVAGTLTVRGRTNPASFDARVTIADGELALDGELPVNRADYGLTWNFIGIAAMDSTIAVHAVFTRG